MSHVFSSSYHYTLRRHLRETLAHHVFGECFFLDFRSPKEGLTPVRLLARPSNSSGHPVRWSSSSQAVLRPRHPSRQLAMLLGCPIPRGADVPDGKCLVLWSTCPGLWPLGQVAFPGGRNDLAGLRCRRRHSRLSHPKMVCSGGPRDERTSGRMTDDDVDWGAVILWRDCGCHRPRCSAGPAHHQAGMSPLAKPRLVPCDAFPSSENSLARVG